MSERNKSILIISDTHFPYQHPDTVAFLRAIKKKYKPTRVVHIGDEVDGHSISFHGADPDLMAPGDELKTAINMLQPIYKMFPKVDLVESNHGSLVYRKGKAHGIPRHVLKSYRAILEAPQGWRWHFDLTLKLPDGSHVYFHHGKSADGLKLSQSLGLNTVQGHYHEKFNLQYWGNSLGLYWSMQVGCLIEDKSLAYSYNKTNLKRPVIGCGVIVDSQPRLIPMVLSKTGRWIGELI